MGSSQTTMHLEALVFILLFSLILAFDPSKYQTANISDAEIYKMLSRENMVIQAVASLNYYQNLSRSEELMLHEAQMQFERMGFHEATWQDEEEGLYYEVQEQSEADESDIDPDDFYFEE